VPMTQAQMSLTQTLMSSEVCCSVLQCVEVCCSVLQCVAVCCSVLQCVAVRCGVCDSSTHESMSDTDEQ